MLLRLIASCAWLPVLAGCAGTSAPEQAPLDEAARRAVKDNPGVSREELARAIDRLFTNPELGETRAVVIMRGGRIVAERYAEGYGPETRFLGWSMSKTVTGILIGMLVADGKLRLDESPPIPHWQRPGDPRGEITLRQLLQMRSGLRHVERAKPEYEGDTVRLLFLEGRDNMAAWAEAQPLEAEAGQVFDYSTATSIILADIATRTLTRNTDPRTRQAVMGAFLRDRLFAPLGLSSMVAEFDAAGTMIGGSMIHATARDWARFGDFLRNGGSVRGAQIVPRRWIEFMARPSPRAPDYGAHLWLNRKSGADREILFPGKARSSVFAAVGHGGQYVIVSPADRLTLVRLGHTRDEARPALVSALGDIVRLYGGT